MYKLLVLLGLEIMYQRMLGLPDPWVGKSPWRRAWQPTPVFSPAGSHGQRSLVGYCPWGRRESDTTEHTQGQTLHLTGSNPRKQSKLNLEMTAYED